MTARQLKPPGVRSHSDVDEMAVRRAVAGDPPERLTIAERAEAVRRLHAVGLPNRRIADCIGIHPRTVRRIRQRLGLPAIPTARRGAA